MNSMEEILWNYIDGNCTPEEQKIITALITEDESYRMKYQELVNLNKSLSSMELDEPSMAFTYNVMETIRTEHAQVPLKAAINKRIIIGIAVFFVTTILALLIFIFANAKLTAPALSTGMAVNFKMPAIDFNKAKTLVQGFVFFDVVVALYLLDAYLRKRITGKQA